MGESDVIVVGAGPAGMIAAEALHAQQLRVRIVESGQWPTSAGEIPEINEPDWRYIAVGSEIDWLRVRAVGGGSLAWGGWCNRFSDPVLRRGHWPIDISELEPYYEAVEKRAGVIPHAVGDRFRSCAEKLGVQLVSMHSSSLQGAPWRSSTSPVAGHVSSETTVTSIEPGQSGFGVLNALSAGQPSQLRFRTLLLACSPVETARLLLASGFAADLPRIGHGLTYHPVAGYALIEPSADTAEKNTSALLVCGADSDLESPGFTIELTGPTSYRDLPPDIQMRVQHAEGLEPSSQITFIHVLGELWPHVDRFVDLDPVQIDAMGRAVPRIHMSWTDAEIDLMRTMQAAALDAAESIASSGGQLVEYLNPIDAPMLFHEAGTCAFGVEQHAPCDSSGRLRCREDIWIADASLFPTSGDRHPTLTILANALRVANAIAAQAR